MTQNVLRFSTRDVPHRDGLDYWSGMVCEKYLELDSVSLETNGRFWSDLELARFGSCVSFIRTGVRKSWHVAVTPPTSACGQTTL
jgi:hypothetical protein